MTRLLIAGGRDYADYWTVYEVLDGFHSSHQVTCVIEGGALGADRFGRHWAIHNGIPFETYEADWATYGDAAGPIRNRQMITVGKPGHIIAFPGGAGTRNMVKQARAAGISVTEIVEQLPWLGLNHGRAASR